MTKIFKYWSFWMLMISIAMVFLIGYFMIAGIFITHLITYTVCIVQVPMVWFTIYELWYNEVDYFAALERQKELQIEIDELSAENKRLKRQRKYHQKKRLNLQKVKMKNDLNDVINRKEISK